MALQLNSDPLILAEGVDTESIHTFRQAVEPQNSESSTSESSLEARDKTKPRVQVVLSVPRVSDGDTVVAAKIEPADTLATEDVPSNDVDVARPEFILKSLEFSREIFTTAKLRIRSVDWVRAGQWVGRPVVTYSSAVVLLVAIIVAIVARPRDPNSTQEPAAGIAVETQQQDEPFKHTQSHLADAPNTQETKSDALPNTSDSIVKIPATSHLNNSSQGHALPWRRDAASETRSPETITQRDKIIPFPPTRSAAHSSTGSNVHPSGRPNVARLEGRIHTPKLPR